MSIATKTGDSGETSLMYGRRVAKTDARVGAYGAVDELNAALGLARSSSDLPMIKHEVLAIQKELIIVMGELATAEEDLDRYAKDGFQVTSVAMVDRLTGCVNDLEQNELPKPEGWSIPGENTSAATLDVARTVCRRAEREVAALRLRNTEVLRYLNRLSDLCWLLARLAEHKHR